MINKIKPLSPDIYLGKTIGDNALARIAHVNQLVDQINNSVPIPSYNVYSFGLKGNTYYFPTVFENTINSDIVYTKVGPGIFTLTSASNCFTANKTMILPLIGKFVPFTDEGINNLFISIGSSTGQISITFYSNVGGTIGSTVDPVMPNEGITLEIRVYN